MPKACKVPWPQASPPTSPSPTRSVHHIHGQINPLPPALISTVRKVPTSSSAMSQKQLSCPTRPSHHDHQLRYTVANPTPDERPMAMGPAIYQSLDRHRSPLMPNHYNRFVDQVSSFPNHPNLALSQPCLHLPHTSHVLDHLRQPMPLEATTPLSVQMVAHHVL